MNRRRALSLLALAATAAVAGPARSVNVCGVTEVLDYSGIDVLPFGGEYIGIGPGGGAITGAFVEITFTTSGSFNAANLGISFDICDAEGCVSVGWTGSQLGWSGQGTFTASFPTDSLNGPIITTGATPFSTTLFSFFNLCPGCGPATGNLDLMKFAIDYAPCPIGDINHDLSVNIDDYTAVVLGWGRCVDPQHCPADVDGDGFVEIDDLTAVILHWHDYCPNCK